MTKGTIPNNFVGKDFRFYGCAKKRIREEGPPGGGGGTKKIGLNNVILKVYNFTPVKKCVLMQTFQNIRNRI